MVQQNKRLTGILITAGSILLIPLIAMQFTAEVNWNLFDFIVAAILLFGTGLILEFALRKITNSKYRLIAILLLFAGLFLLWAELAVGIFGSPIAGS